MPRACPPRPRPSAANSRRHRPPEWPPIVARPVLRSLRFARCQPEPLAAECVILGPHPGRPLPKSRKLLRRLGRHTPQHVARLVRPPEKGQRPGSYFVYPPSAGPQPDELTQRLQRRSEIASVELNATAPQRPEPNQRIVRTGAHRSPQPLQRLLAVPAEAQHTTEHANDEGAVWIERKSGARLRNRLLPFTAPHHHVREDRVCHSVLIVERHGAHRFLPGRPLNLEERAGREVPNVPLQGERVAVTRGRKVWVELNRPSKKIQRDPVFFGGISVEVPKAALAGLPCVQALRRLAQHPLLLGLRQRRLYNRGDTCGNFVLHREDVAEIAIITVVPDMRGIGRVDQLRCHADPVAAFAHRAFEHIADTQLAPDPLYVDRLAFVSEARITGDDKEPANAGERGNDLLDHPVGEILLLPVSGHVLKGQDRDRRLVGERGRRSGRQRRAGRCAENDSIGAHGSCDVLDLLLAEIVKGEVEAVAHLLVRRGAEADPARLGQRFEPGGDVDAVAENVAILDDDVADIDAHAKFDVPLCRCRGVTGEHLPLHLDRTAHRIDDAGELGEEAVAGRLDDATPMLGDFGIAQFTANRSQRRERALFVLAHQPRIAGDIDRQNGRQSSLDPRFAHLARQTTGRSAAEDMMELSLPRAPLRRGSEFRVKSGPLAGDNPITGLARLDLQARHRQALLLLYPTEAIMSAPTGPGIVLQPDEGVSYWQPVWANGYSTIKIGPKDRVENLTMGVQVIAAGGYVREHSHTPNEEILFCFSGRGTIVVDGVPHPFVPGTTVYAGPG